MLSFFQKRLTKLLTNLKTKDMMGFFKLRWLESYYSSFENTQVWSFLIISIRILAVALLRMLQLILLIIYFVIAMPFELIMRFNLNIIKRIEGKDISFFDSDEE